jgi:hypothetical protein
MTYMLSTLAGGKVVVALEVSLSVKRCRFEFFFLTATGGIHARIALQLRIGCWSDVIRRGPSGIASSSVVRGRG